MSVHTLELDNPVKITVDGKLVETKELNYDPLEITVDLYARACAKAAEAAKSGSFSPKMRETDYNLHLYLGMAAVIAVNPNIDFTDLEHIKGFDLIDLSNIGLLFTIRKSAEPSETESGSESSSGATPVTSIAASEKSEK